MKRPLSIVLLLLPFVGASKHEHSYRCPAWPSPGCNVLRTCTCSCGAKRTERSEDCATC